MYNSRDVGDRSQTLERFAATASWAVPYGDLMTGNRHNYPPRRAAGDKSPTRDGQGRWVRRTVVAEEDAAQDFVFDDRVIEEMLPAEAEPPPLRVNNAERAPDSGFSIAADSLPMDRSGTKAGFGPVSTANESHPEAAPIFGRIFPPSFRLLGGALLLGVVFFVFEHSYFSTKRAEEITPPPPPTIVAPVVVPPVPRQTVRLSAIRSVAVPRLKRELPVVEGDTVPADVAASQEKLDEEGWFSLAEEYLQLGDENRAEALYRRILTEGTQKGRAALALGDHFARRNDFKSAQEFYRASKRLFQGKDQPASPP